MNKIVLTKSDLKAIFQLVKTAIKEEAITKNEAKSFITKDDLKNFATKDDLVGLARGIEIDDLKNTFLDNLTKWKSDLFDKIDKVLGRVKTAEEENTILNAREETRHEEREKLDARLHKLETIHPDYHHQTT